MSHELLANPLIESFSIELGDGRVSATGPPDRGRHLPRLERRRRRGARARAPRRRARSRLARGPALPEGTEGVVLPGGFSYGDYLRCGAIARFAPVMDVGRRVRAPRAGRCSGSATASRSSARRACCPASCGRTASSSSSAPTSRSRSRARRARFAGGWELGQELVIPIKHGEGNWYGDAELVARARGARADRVPLQRGRERRGRANRRRHERGAATCSA